MYTRLYKQGELLPLPRRPEGGILGPYPLKYCQYHQLAGHSTDDCHTLRLELQHRSKAKRASSKEPISINLLSLDETKEDPTELMVLETLKLSGEFNLKNTVKFH